MPNDCIQRDFSLQRCNLGGLLRAARGSLPRVPDTKLKQGHPTRASISVPRSCQGARDSTTQEPLAYTVRGCQCKNLSLGGPPDSSFPHAEYGAAPSPSLN